MTSSSRQFDEQLVAVVDDHDLRRQLWIQGFELKGKSATGDVWFATRTVLDLAASVFMWGTTAVGPPRRSLAYSLK
ncbi:hypothetical protein [Haladaptatus sp. DFWS20]|uniref:hypothetical protein n=1 Tax=Haladaptatus sp. DFWS20 TaxID=3403467 RepID=UPI003EBA7248